jgi:hypothetical protein
MGLAWALAYSVIDTWIPGSFAMSDAIQ